MARNVCSRITALGLAVLGVLAPGCGPGKDTSSTGTGTSAASTTDGDGTTDGATSPPTSSTGAAMGCIGADPAACAASTPLGGENLCVWVDVYTASIGGTVCRTALARSTCMESNGNEGGPGCLPGGCGRA